MSAASGEAQCLIRRVRVRYVWEAPGAPAYPQCFEQGG